MTPSTNSSLDNLQQPRDPERNGGWKTCLDRIFTMTPLLFCLLCFLPGVGVCSGQHFHLTVRRFWLNWVLSVFKHAWVFTSFPPTSQRTGFIGLMVSLNCPNVSVWYPALTVAGLVLVTQWPQKKFIRKWMDRCCYHQQKKNNKTAVLKG